MRQEYYPNFVRKLSFREVKWIQMKERKTEEEIVRENEQSNQNMEQMITPRKSLKLRRKSIYGFRKHILVKEIFM